MYSSIEAQNLVNFYNQSVFAEDLNPSYKKELGSSGTKPANNISNRYHNNS